MYGAAFVVSQVILGLSLLAVLLAIFVLIYVAIVTEKINCSIVVLFGVGLMILFGVLYQSEVFVGIDFNIIGLLTGMMVIVAIIQKSGVFQYVVVVAVKFVCVDFWGLLVMLLVVMAVFFALFDNVIIVLLIVLVVLFIIDVFKFNFYFYLFVVIFFFNIGGAAILIGDLFNIMIGLVVRLVLMIFLFIWCCWCWQCLSL